MNTAVSFDTHEFVRSLESGDVATKADVRKLDTKTETAITLLRKDVEMFEQRTTARFTLLQWMLGAVLGGIIVLVLKSFF